MPTRIPSKSLLSIYRRLLAVHGPRHWWPAESRFEVLVGAVLTQNTAWSNVEKAIGNLKHAGLLSLDGLLGQAPDELAALIRPAGYFNVKAARLGNLCRFLRRHGDIDGLAGLDTALLRQRLLGVNGVGPETADDILLYAFERPVFVIDAYTRRILSRYGLIAGDEPYESLRLGIQEALPEDVELFNEYHALIVHHSKYFCKVKALCTGCPLGRGCKRRMVS